MKISIIGAGNVGSLTAMRLAEESAAEVVLVDVVKGLALGKSLDLEDIRPLLKYDYNIKGSDDINQIKDSDIIVVTAGLARKPGMSREDLLHKNADIVREVSQSIKRLAGRSIVIIVTNPVDILTYLALKETGFNANRVLGMGPSLDAARFANLISKELNIPNTNIDSCVIGSHGEGMLPLPRFTYIKGAALEELADSKKIELLKQRTVGRGAEIVSCLGSGSAFFAPSLAAAIIVKTILKDEKRTIGVSAYLNGEYGLTDVCIGVPARLGRQGIEKIIELDLNQEERQALHKSADSLKKQIGDGSIFPNK
jgi:malate dehydrogenase